MYLRTGSHGVTTQNNNTDVYTAEKTSDLRINVSFNEFQLLEHTRRILAAVNISYSHLISENIENCDFTCYFV